MNHWTPDWGLPYPMGCNWDSVNKGYNFAIFSKSATQISLKFFASDSPSVVVFQYDFDPVTNKIGSIWNCFIKEPLLLKADCFAYQISGPGDPGNRFDPAKSLLDPWAKAIFFPPAFSRVAAINPGDNTGKAPLSLLLKTDDTANILNSDVKPVHYSDLIIYEVHVRGFTASASSGVVTADQGTFNGIVQKIPYLKDLGITAVELMPIHQFDPQDGNYWGYMTLNFFAPHLRYSSDPSGKSILTEFKKMVLALHQAGIEVILDVVYNHTTEGNEAGPLYSFKGIDNSSYYLLTSDLNYYINDTGTGNVMRTSYKQVRQHVLESLRYWVQEMHVDGFRFDLATIFTRNDDGSVNLDNPPILEEISMDPVLSSVRLIAEPWDEGTDQLGVLFPGTNWAQWNGAFRDDIRSFVKGDTNKVGTVMSRIYGSQDLFNDQLPFSARPFQSVNFINCHDGFTLYDLVSYNDKHNLANGQNNSDGTDNNISWNGGWEGDLNVPAAILGLRKKQAKNFMTLLMFSNGIPMFRMGDEFLQTQNGNNNPYNQDNAVSWLDWTRKDGFSDFYLFCKTVIAFRKAHPSVCRGSFWKGDIHWYGVGDLPDLSFDSHSIAWFLSGTAMADDDFYVMINAWWQPLSFTVQEGQAGQWKCIIDTSLDSPADITDFNTAAVMNNMNYMVDDRSVVVLQRKPINL